MSGAADRYRYTMRLGWFALVGFAVVLAVLGGLIAIGLDGSPRVIGIVVVVVSMAGLAFALRSFKSRGLVVGADEIQLAGFIGRRSSAVISEVEFTSEVHVKTAFAGDEALLALWVPGSSGGLRTKFAERALDDRRRRHLEDARNAGRPLVPVFIPLEGLEPDGRTRLRELRRQIDAAQQ